MKMPTPDFDPGTVLYPKVAPLRENAVIVTGYTVRPGPTSTTPALWYLVTDSEGEESERARFELTDEPSFGAEGGVE